MVTPPNRINLQSFSESIIPIKFWLGCNRSFSFNFKAIQWLWNARLRRLHYPLKRVAETSQMAGSP